MQKGIPTGQIFELSNERQITGRRKIKVVLHEIFSNHNEWQENGISWDEKYTQQTIDSVSNMSLCVEFISEDRTLPYGHGLTEISDMPYMEDATVVGHFERGYIDDIEIDSRFQASSGDVPFATHSFREYPIATQTISAGYAVDYRELQSGNFDGTVAEGMAQVQTDMQNKAVYYVIAKLYEALKNAKGVKHFAESSGITQTAVDDMLKVMRRYGKTNICGDYAVVSQLNDFADHKTFGASTIPFGADAVADEIRKTGLLSFYNGSNIVELPNALDFTRLNEDKTSYELYMPQGLLFFIPQGNIAPLQIFRRGGLTTMTGDDIVTRQHLTRFDMEIGAGVAEGMEDQIGLLSDTNFEVPTL